MDLSINLLRDRMTVDAFLGLLLAVTLLRLVELRISKRHQREMAARGAAKVDEPKFRWMVLLHTAVLLGAALEVVFLRRPFLPWLAVPMFLAQRLSTEERVLFANPDYRAAMTGKPRFLPGLF